MLEMLSFLLTAVGISLSGVMAPGPMTTATLAAGTRRRHAGLVLALGHGVVEFPLMILITAGMGRWFKFEGVKLGIGLVGGIFLLFMGVQLLREARKFASAALVPGNRGDLVTGILMTGGNPYFLLWWATIGLALATRASELGVVAFALFAAIHWLCDLGWLEALSYASFRGTRLLSDRGQRIVLVICGLALVFFAGTFLWDAGRRLLLFYQPPG